MWVRRSISLLLVLVCVQVNSAARASTIATLSETFKTGWMQRWSIHASPQNQVKASNGVLNITARQNTYAYISRNNSLESVRVSARLKSGDGISWSTSLFLYWGTGDWVQVGLILDGRYYINEMIGGKAFEFRKAVVGIEKWHYVSLELGRDVLRTYASEDGKKWTLLRSIARPTRWKAAPSKIIVGKGYGTGTQPYDHPNLENDYSDAGPVSQSAVAEIKVAPTSKSNLRASAEDKRIWSGENRDVAGDKILAQPGDPTFEQIRRLYPPMKNAREAVGVKDHPNEFIIEPDGAVLFGGDNSDEKAPRVAFLVGQPPIRIGSRESPIKKSVIAGIPAVILHTQNGGVQYTQTIAAWSEGMSPDKETWVYLQLECQNTTTDWKNVNIQLATRPGERPITSPAWTLKIGPKAKLIFQAKAPFTIAGLRFYNVEPTEWTKVWTEIQQFWKPANRTRTVLTVPDPRIQKLYAMSLAYAFVNVDKIKGVYEPHDGSGFYELVYGYSAVLFCNALDLWGYHQDAERYIDSLLTFMKPDGLFEVNYGLADMGGLLLAMSQHYQMTGDREWLLRVAPKMKQVGDWLIEHRKISMHLVNGKRPVTYGLIKYRPYCDYVTPTFTYLSDCYGTIGLEQMSQAFASGGLKDDSTRYAREAKAYRADILASMKAAVVTHNGHKMLPMEPETLRLLKDNGYTGADYYGLVAPMVLETGFLSPQSPYAKMIVDQLENRNGLILRMCKFSEGIDHAYTYGYWLDLLKRDQVRPVLVALYGSMAYGMSQDTFAAVECTQILTGLNDRTTPHTYSATQQLRLLRMMMIREEGDQLWIGQAIPREWLKGNKKVAFDNAPTLFGNISFSIQADEKQGRIYAQVTCPLNPNLKTIHLRIRCPEGKKAVSASIGGQPVPIVNETILLKPSSKPINVVVKIKA